MAELKTLKTNQAPEEFLNSIEPEAKRLDGLALLKLFTKITGEKPVMWGTSIVGFGQYHYKSERSTQEGDWPLVGFSPRKQNLTLYIMAGNKDNTEQLQKLGKHKSSVGCVYINKLADVDMVVLAELIKESYEYMRKSTER
ncbi:MAG: DUF1801 domain-containing protein [bacterium]|nr:DUF1801 domain-containing protein [bacterium]